MNDNRHEQWIHWKPYGSESKEYEVISCCDDHKAGLIIILRTFASKPKKELHFIWKNQVVSYKKMQERLLGNTLIELNKHYGTNFYANWKFFKITDSKYLYTLRQQLGSVIKDGCDYKHFVFFLLEDILDVVALDEPEVKIIDVPENE